MEASRGLTAGVSQLPALSIWQIYHIFEATNSVRYPNESRKQSNIRGPHFFKHGPSIEWNLAHAECLAE